MRTDVKVGLICLFILALGLVCYFTLRSNKSKQDIVTSSVPVTPIPAAAPATEPSSASLTPPAETSAPTTAPSQLADASAAGAPATPMLAASADVQASGSFGGMIPPPGAATAPSLSTPTTPSNAPSLNMSLVPPASHTSSAAPTLTSPLNTGGSSGSLLPPSTSAAPAVPTPPGNTIDLDHPTRRNTLDLSTPSPAPQPSSPSMEMPSDAGSSGSMGGAGGTYKIQKGDTLAAIAKKNHITLKALQAANPGVNPNRLKIGQKINMPGASAASSSSLSNNSTPAPTLELGNAAPGSSAATPLSRPGSHRNTTSKSHKAAGAKGTPAKRRAPAGGTYTVKKGDTLRKIAKSLYGEESLWRRIFRANRGELSSPNDIHPGEVLHLPK